jgi:DNA-binding XRE family transcriptional regulator
MSDNIKKLKPVRRPVVDNDTGYTPRAVYTIRTNSGYKTQSAFAEVLGVSRSTYITYERFGVLSPSLAFHALSYFAKLVAKPLETHIA